MRHFIETLNMKNKFYDILLDNGKIGTTELEKADAPMGTVYGKINFKDMTVCYDFLKTYCMSNGIGLVFDYPDEKLISTKTIGNLVVRNELGIEICGTGNQICGMDGDEYEITLEGIPYPFFEDEFPHHVKFNKEQFNDD